MEGSLVRRRSEEPALGSALAFGIDAIDAHLPCGRLGPGLHEIASAGRDGGFAAAPARLAAHLLGASGAGTVLWVTGRRDLFAPGLAGSGLPAGRLLVAEAGRDVLAVMEEGARCKGLGGVVGEIGDALTLIASRRLLLAAETSGVPVIAIPRLWRGQATLADAPNAAITRWRVAALPSRPADPVLGAGGAGPFTLTFGAARWRLDLVRARGAAPSSWIVEAFDETGRLALPAPSLDRPAASREQRAADQREQRAAVQREQRATSEREQRAASERGWRAASGDRAA